MDPKQSGLQVIKNVCSTQLSMEFILLINVKMPSIVGILTFLLAGRAIKQEIPIFFSVLVFMSS